MENYMALPRRGLPFKLAAAALTFVAVILALRGLDGSGPELPVVDSAAGGSAAALPGATTRERVASLQAQLDAGPVDPEGYGQLGLLYLQQVRETGDPTLYARAEGAFREALRADRESFTATSGLGSLALARHEFRRALALGERARRINPQIPRNYGVIADAQIELGRYSAAADTLQRWVNLKPELSSYARVSYFRELHGDLGGALAAMRLAVSSGGDSPENFSYVETLVGNLHFTRGAYGAAEGAYRRVLAADPDYAPAIAGLARVEAGRGELDSAIRRYREVVRVLPLPEYVIALGETELAAGRAAAAKRDFALVEAQTRLLRANGVNTDVDLALFEADHGSPRRAVALARGAWRDAPSVRSADAYSWALSQTGQDERALALSEEAMRLGSRDSSFLYHAGEIARRAGRPVEAKALLDRLLDQSPRFSALHAPRARAALRSLG
jgi:tetratricopeptide (TPR) repeat protein